MEDSVGATDAAGDGLTSGVAVAVGCEAGAVVPTGCDSRTERVPENSGSESTRDSTKNIIVAPMVILASSVCVPRGPKAVLETELVNSAPASALPGCNNTETINTKQAITKIV